MSSSSYRSKPSFYIHFVQRSCHESSVSLEMIFEQKLISGRSVRRWFHCCCCIAGKKRDDRAQTCKKLGQSNEGLNASSGSRTRANCLEGNYPTVGPRMLDENCFFRKQYIMSVDIHDTFSCLIVSCLPRRIEGPWHQARWVCVTEFINMHASRLSWRFRLARYPVSPAFLTGVIRRKIRCDAARVEMRSAAHAAALDLTGKLKFQYPIAV
jgi:hypothetical protein